ncbi:hypothetical protein ACTRXD_03590 [Nitrospira sp. T9]|uniref:hypothetical protein n=1 Tax=unclassified Nitrospira TaxID=2652172 RepID=UPI003F9B892B
MAKARLVLTDSGEIQEETTILGVACVTQYRASYYYRIRNESAGRSYQGKVLSGRPEMLSLKNPYTPYHPRFGTERRPVGLLMC